MANVADISEADFQTEVLDSTQPVLVDFWAPWCAPCRAIGPIIEKLAAAYAGKVKVGKINVDQNNQLAAEYRVYSIPTVMIFKDGKVVDQMVGFPGEASLKQRVQAALDQA
jgi:thioredoxin 1